MLGGDRGVVDQKTIQPEPSGLPAMEIRPTRRSVSIWSTFWTCGILAVVLDQGTKWLALSTLDPYNPPTILPGLFELQLVHNDGAAFSLFQGGRWMFIAVSIAAAFFLPLYLKSLIGEGESHPFYPLGLGLIWGGAMGNALDRIFREQGLVVDFFHVVWSQYSFPVFNVADSAITLGLVALLFVALFLKSPNQIKDEQTDASDTL